MDRISVGLGGAPLWAVSAPDLNVGAWGTDADKGKPACAHPPRGGRSSRQERKRLVPVCFLLRVN